jgi:SWI/SNF-related matrix-associated actin-dependent regulator of chromatin subfamily A3
MVSLSIVFSAWKKTLGLIACILIVKCVPYVTIDGSMSLAERRKVLSKFHTEQDARVLLMTLGTGAVK